MCGDYKTLDELLKQPMDSVYELGNFYYILLSNERDSDAIWKVDKRTGKASYMQYPAYIVEVKGQAKEIDPATLRRGA